jgi:Cu(I)/Ag(I) efflux system membrane fusion protein
MSSSTRRKIWTAIRILNVRLRFILLMVITGLIAAQWDQIAARWERWTRPKHEVTQAAEQTEYYCPMHPSVVRGEPGNCPICGMPLVKRTKGEQQTLPEGVIGRVELAPYRMQLAGVATSEVGTQPLNARIRTVGTIEEDERRVAHIASRVSGRIEKLHVDFTGATVRAGEPLAEIYSPELVSTQQEYLLARKNLDRLRSVSPAGSAGAGGTGGAGSGSAAIETAQSVLDAARERLRLWGITGRQIETIDREGTPSLAMTVESPASGIVTQKDVLEGQYVSEGTELYTVADLATVWMTANVYEDEMDRVKLGQKVEITSDALPGKALRGTISFVWPSVDPATRTLRIRADIPNPQLELRPGMYVEARLESGNGGASTPPAAAPVRYTCPMHPQVISDQPGRCPICGMFLVKMEAPANPGVLAVPESAVIDTGERKVVYLEREEGIFDAVEVTLGPLSDGFYPVRSGLASGDRVVTRGAFLVDAELRLNPGAAGSYFGASGGPAAGDPQDH